MGIGWDGLIGHEENISQLRALAREGRFPHAVLFSGPAGVGKRRIARVLAAALLCGRGDEPCGVCPSCKAFSGNSHPDYYEIHAEARGKAAKVIRIEQIREMQSAVARLPILSERRVVLIDEAGLMNEAAENSLLKTLEEPLGQVTFFLVTSARSSLLDTIVSRCMPMRFGMLPAEGMASLLVQQGVSGEEAGELAIFSDGSMERACMLQGSRGMELRKDAEEFLEKLGSMTMDDLWLRGKSMGDMGRDEISEWFLYLNLLLRDMLVLYGDGGSNLIYYQAVRPRLLDMLPKFSEARIFAMLRLVKDAQRRLQANVSLRLFMEGFLIRFMDCGGSCP